IREIIAINANNEQNRLPFVYKLGNQPKGQGKYTAKQTWLTSGWRIIPDDSISYNLDILSEILSEDEISDRDVFDRSGLVNVVTVNIDAIYDKIEIREVYINGGGSDETTIHNALDSYANKEDFQADIAELSETVDDIHELITADSCTSNDIHPGRIYTV
ncbi:MAG: hypothetical protein GY829_16245, partial [Gammaproteobacteria bacterium]|nr:hypothetical protein [Gammaproteobacteria bacterium]